ncbi:hypothetical protein V6N11_050055 [Hibiscus sabdariffa]|uniref:Uncharacterized protein n=1 Tax=Hibiscus sabdariffa TaxID=183260 RepID=A0ABR2T9E3_9ROSI
MDNGPVEVVEGGVGNVQNGGRNCVHIETTHSSPRKWLDEGSMGAGIQNCGLTMQQKEKLIVARSELDIEWASNSNERVASQGIVVPTKT